MANLSFRFLANDKGLKDGIKNSKKQLSGFEKSTKKISSGIGKALGGIGIGLGATAIVNGLVNMTKAAAADVKSQKLLALQLQTTTNATDQQVRETEKWLNTLSNATGVLDDDLRPALANAVRGSGSLKKGQKLLRIALDGATASGKPLNTVLQALIKASNGQTASLYKLAPELKKTKGNIDDYAKSVKGAAEAGADPFAKFNVAIENLTEQFGMYLLPYVEDFVTYMTEQLIPQVSKFIEDMSNPGTEVGAFFKKISVSLVGEDGKGGMVKSLGDATIALIDLFSVFGDQDRTELEKTADLFAFLAASIKLVADNIAILLKNPITGIPKVVSNQLGFFLPTLGITPNNPRSRMSKDTQGVSARALENTVSSSMTRSTSYNIYLNKANMTPAEIVAAIKKYERDTGKKP